MLGLGEGDFIAGDDQRLADGFGLDDNLHGLGAVGRLRAHHTLASQIGEGARDLRRIAAFDVIGAKLRGRGQLDTIQLLNERFKLSASLRRCFDDQRVGRGLGADMHFFGFLQMRQGTTTPIQRHRRLRIQLVHRLGQIHRSREFQREDHRFAFSLGVSGAVHAIDELFDLVEDLGVCGDDQGVGRGIGVDGHGYFAPLLSRSRVVTLAQHPG